MHVVIDISEEEYKTVCEGVEASKKLDFSIPAVFEAVANGTPLPKRHGRLIDVNNLLDRIGLEDNDSNREDNVGEIVTLEDFDYIPTIIEAESGGEE